MMVNQKGIPTQGSILFDIERPFELGAGIAVKLLQKCLTLASDIQFTDWTQTQYSAPPSEDVSRDNFERFYDKTVQIRVGAEYQIKKIDAYTRVVICMTLSHLTRKKLTTIGIP